MAAVRAALVDEDGHVVNVILIDPDQDYTPRDGLTVYELDEDAPVDPGWRRTPDGFEPPAGPTGD